MGGGVGKGKVGLWCGRSREREGWVVVWEEEKGKGMLGCGVGGVGKGKVGLWYGRRREREGCIAWLHKDVMRSRCGKSNMLE